MANPFASKPTVNHPEPAPSLNLDLTLPNITFGTEQEFNFAVKKSTFQIYDDKSPPVYLPTKASNESTSHNTGSEKKEFLVNHLRYIYFLLTHEHEHIPNYGTFSILSPIHYADPKVHPYDKYTLVLDDSVMPKWRAHIKALSGVDVEVAFESDEEWEKAERMLREKLEDAGADLEAFIETVREKYDRVGAELVSKVLKYDDQEYWMKCLRQIESDLTWDEKLGHGAWVDEDPHLHIHMTMIEDPPLRTVQNIVVLYGLFEPEIERWHPASQRNNHFCWSMRKGTQLSPYTPHTFAQEIYAAESLEDLKSLLVDQKMVDIKAIGIDRVMFDDWVQVNISPARGVKPTTLEFRQHRGTLNAEEIKWWTIFCANMFQYAHTLTESGIMIANVQSPSEQNGKVDFLLEYSKQSILEHLDFPEEGVKFFRAKEKEYWNDHSERRSRLSARVCEARMWFLARNLTGNTDWKLGAEMEQIIRDTPWYEADFKGYKDAKNADVKEQRRRAEVRRKAIENSEREKSRVLRGLVRRRARSEAQRQNKLDEPGHI